MTLILWFGFIIFIASLLMLDLGVFHKSDKEPTARDAVRWTLVWILVGVSFSGVIYLAYAHHWLGIGLTSTMESSMGGAEAAIKYLTGYVIEYSLSLDNIFVMALIFGYFKIPSKYQHRVLFWGILGAILMRAAMILAGTALVRAFDWTLYLFGAFLVFTAIKMLFKDDEEIDPEQSWIVKWARKVYPVTTEVTDNRFFTRLPDGRKAITRLFLTLLLIENTDVVFAVDSIPAIFAVTTDPFIVFTSNIFAILGLRSLYFALNAMLGRFHLLKYSLVFILAYVGLKMLSGSFIHIPELVSLAIIVLALGTGVCASLICGKKENPPKP